MDRDKSPTSKDEIRNGLDKVDGEAVFEVLVQRVNHAGLVWRHCKLCSQSRDICPPGGQNSRDREGGRHV